MRRIRYQVACSADGFIAGPNGENDWILMDPEIDFAAFMAEFDTLLMGRTTFESALEMGGGGMGPFAGMKTVVVSSTLDPAKHPDVTITRAPLRDVVGELRSGPGKDVWLFGGGQLFRGLLELGLVDTVELAVIPILLGGGIPLLPSPAARAKLKLTGHRVYATTGTVMLTYAALDRMAGDAAMG